MRGQLSWESICLGKDDGTQSKNLYLCRFNTYPSRQQAEGRRFEPVTSHHFTGISSVGSERCADNAKVLGSNPRCPTNDTISETHLGYTTQQIVSIRLAAILSESSVVPFQTRTANHRFSQEVKTFPFPGNYAGSIPASKQRVQYLHHQCNGNISAFQADVVGSSPIWC